MGHAGIVKKEEAARKVADAAFKREVKQADKSFSRVNSSLRLARVEEYKVFLDVRFAPCTHFYGYNMPDGFYVAMTDCVIPAFFGAKSINVIAPSGVNVEHSDGFTHNNIFSMDDPNGGSWVPSYNDANQD